MDIFNADKIDSHVHVFDPASFPYQEGNFYLPTGGETGTPDLFKQLMDIYCVRHALLVGPNSGYGTDNSCLLAAIKQGAGRFKGIAVVANDIGYEELAELKKQGIIGVAINAALLGTEYYANCAGLMEKLDALDMFAQLQVMNDQLVALTPLLHSSNAKILIDHCGRPDPSQGTGQDGFRQLLQLADSGHVYVKLSGQYKISQTPYPYPDMKPFIKALLSAYSADACVWASDWPYLRASQRIDYAPSLKLMESYVKTEAEWQKILWKTPARLFGFGV